MKGKGGVGNGSEREEDLLFQSTVEFLYFAFGPNPQCTGVVSVSFFFFFDLCYVSVFFFSTKNPTSPVYVSVFVTLSGRFPR